MILHNNQWAQMLFDNSKTLSIFKEEKFLNVLKECFSDEKEKDYRMPINMVLLNIRFYEKTLTGKMKIVLHFNARSQSSTLLMQKLLEKNVKILSFYS